MPAQTSISAVLGRDIAGYYLYGVGGGFAAYNPQQELLSLFNSQGLELRSAGTRWRLSLRGYGYGEAVRSVAGSVPQARLNRVEYRRGSITEWYVNGPAGVEQGFTISKRPAQAYDGPLTLVLEILGNFTARMDRDRTSVTLKSLRRGKDLRCTALRAVDVTGRDLRTWFEVRDREIRLRVDDRHATYPVVVDPLMQLAELTASDGQLSYQPRLGVSVAVSGNTVVAGAPGAQIGGTVGQGAVYVFVKPRYGWTKLAQVAKLTASDGAYVDGLGQSVAISDNTVVAGSNAMIGQNFLQGAVYVFVRPDSGWKDMTQTAKLTASDGQQDDLLGASVSISGNTIVAGAPHATQLAGKAYVFVMPQGGWKDMTQTAELTPSDPILDSIFGASVQINDDTVVVGEPYKNRAYVFVKPTNGWTNIQQTAELTPTDVTTFDLFGQSVTVSKNTVVIGKPSATNSGSAYIFIKPANGWTNMTQTAKLSASDGTPGDYFGASVFTNGNEIFVGANSATVGSNGQQGAAYVFAKPPNGWKDTSEFKSKWTASDGAAGYFFGFSVAASRSIAVIGAPYTNLGFDNTAPGAAYIFGRQH